MSTNYSADLETRVEPCVFGGNPDCSQCGCAISSGLHWLKDFRLGGLVKLDHIVATSVSIGSTIGVSEKVTVRMSVGGTLRPRHWFKLALSATRKFKRVEQEKNSGECRETIRTEEGSLDRHADF
jgi:hypothetical protein